MRLGFTIVLAAAVLGITAAAATAASPTKYRDSMNAICKVYGAKLVAQQDAMSHASVARKTKKFEVAFRKYLVLSLRQNHQLESVKIPPSLQATMKPVVKMMKKADAHLFKALVSSRHGDLRAARSQLKTLSRVAGQLPNQLDSVGLISCGSLQQQ
jgi:O-succinylbenzoate synthase